MEDDRKPFLGLTEEQLERFRAKYPNKTMPRTCGSCYVCCVWLGIEELRKKGGKACRHLTGTQGPEKRCSIYEIRPQACVRYQCGWIEGLGEDAQRPDQSGVLISAYPESFTFRITDHKKAGTIKEGNLANLLHELIGLGADNIVVVDDKNKKVTHFYQGNIYDGKLLKQDGYEDMKFMTTNPPIGRYESFEKEKGTKGQ